MKLEFFMKLIFFALIFLKIIQNQFKNQSKFNLSLKHSIFTFSKVINTWQQQY